MVFKRTWDSSCPQVWDKWEADGVKWVIQDLRPEDDDLAMQFMLYKFCPDEVLCSTLGIDKDPEALRGMQALWEEALSQRMTLACYKEVGGTKALVALNVCYVKCTDDKEHDYDKINSDKFDDLIKTMKYLDEKCDVSKILEADTYLYGLGLFVTREHRGAKLGQKLLAAREPMCRKVGLTSTSTMFTGVASQKCAEKCGFITVLEVSLSEFAKNGIKYPMNDERIVKIMVKKYK